MNVKEYKKKDKNVCNGFTLVEVIIVIAIISVVVLAITSMMSTSTKVYNKESQDIDLQQEAQFSMNQLEDMIISANGLRIASHALGASGEITVIDYKAKDDSDSEQHYYIIWIKDKNSLYFKKDTTLPYNAQDVEITSLASGVQDEVNLMARNVKSFKITMATSKNSVIVEVEFQLHITDNNTYSMTKQIKLRNKQV